MIRLPKLYDAEKERDVFVDLRGMNRTEFVDTGKYLEFSETMNMSADDYPSLSVRDRRAAATVYPICAARMPDLEEMEVLDVFECSGKVFFIQRGIHYFDEEHYIRAYEEHLIEILPDGGGLEVAWRGLLYSSETKRTVRRHCVMGAYVMFIPENMIYNAHTNKLRPIAETMTWDREKDGTEGSSYIATKTTGEAGSAAYGSVCLRIGSADSPTNPHWDEKFSKGDWVKVDNFASAMAFDHKATFWTRVCYAEERYIGLWMDGVMDEEGKWEFFCAEIGIEQIRITRPAIPLDYICSNNNRIFGCYRGRVDGKEVDEIYACALGNPFNWKRFDTTAMASYTASVGQTGAWTGCAAYGDDVLFFKEDAVMRLRGTRPANYELMDFQYPGAAKGCDRSIATVRGLMLWASPEGVVVYDGTYPTVISQKLALRNFKDCFAGVFRSKYYLCRSDGADKELYVFDIERGTWHSESCPALNGFMESANCLFMLEKKDLIRVGGALVAGAGTMRLTKTNKYDTFPPNIISPGDSFTDEDAVEWRFVTGNMGVVMPGQKYLRKIILRANIPIGSVIRLSIEYDSSGDYESIGEMTGTSLAAVEIPILPRRCDHFKMKFEGKGKVRFVNITKEWEVASDVRI